MVTRREQLGTDGESQPKKSNRGRGRGRGGGRGKKSKDANMADGNGPDLPADSTQDGDEQAEVPEPEGKVVEPKPKARKPEKMDEMPQTTGRMKRPAAVAKSAAKQDKEKKNKDTTKGDTKNKQDQEKNDDTTKGTKRKQDKEKNRDTTKGTKNKQDKEKNKDTNKGTKNKRQLPDEGEVGENEAKVPRTWGGRWIPQEDSSSQRKMLAIKGVWELCLQHKLVSQSSLQSPFYKLCNNAFRSANIDSDSTTMEQFKAVAELQVEVFLQGEAVRI